MPNCSLAIKHLWVLDILQHLLLFALITVVFFLDVSHFLFQRGWTAVEVGVVHLTKRFDRHVVFGVLDAQLGFALAFSVGDVRVWFNYHLLLLPSSKDLLFQALLIA